MTFAYVIWSVDSGRVIKGELELPDNTTLDQAILKTAHEGARIAYEMEFPWDPFNLKIILRPRKHSAINN